MKNTLLTKNSTKVANTASALSIFSIIFFIVVFALICSSIVFANSNIYNLNYSSINASTNIILLLLAITFLSFLISFYIIEKQGANTKTKVIYYIASCCIALSVVMFFSFVLTWISLFISALSLFFNLILLHELKKTNKKAYYLHIPVCFICSYLIVYFYVLCLIN